MSNLRDVLPGALDELGLEVPFVDRLEGGEQFDGGFSVREFNETPFAESTSEGTGAWSEGSGDTSVAFESVAFPSGLVLQTTSGATDRDEEHYDPSKTGLPLLATGPSTHARLLSPHFTVRDLVSSGGRAVSVARISPALVRVLEAIRERAGKRVRITSGYRSWARNRQVYAARGQEPTKSRHCSGQAADIKIAGMTGSQIARLAIDAAGTDLALGIGRDYLHVDVRGKWKLWTYFPRGGPADRAAKADAQRHRERRLRGLAPVPQSPMPEAPESSHPRLPAAHRLVVREHPLLRQHRGTPPDLILRWNRIGESDKIDVVVHFHGYDGKRAGMRLHLDKEPMSGLDFSDPAAPSSPGRDRPTVAILPRGNYFGGKSKKGYNFPALVRPGALQQFIDDGLARLGSLTGRTLQMERLILSGHSGGGAPVSALLAHTDPDEVRIFDGMYGSGANIVRWAKRRITRELAAPGPLPPALRILYRPGSSTQPHSEAVADALYPFLRPSAAARLRPYFRVDRTSVDHGKIPGQFGWLLLTNPAANLPGAKTYTGARGRSGKTGGEVWEDRGASESWQGAPIDREESEREAMGAPEYQFLEADEAIDSSEAAAEASDRWDREALAWLDVEAPGAEMEWEPPVTEAEWLEPETSEAGWSESVSGEGPEGEELESFEASEPEESRWAEGEEFEPEASEADWSQSLSGEGPEGEELEPFEALEPEESRWAEGEGRETPYGSEEWREMEGGEEVAELERFGEFEDERDSEWESAEFEEEPEGEISLDTSNLTPAQQKAVEITSTFETGKRGGFFGLAGNFDGQGLSFGLVNWTIGTGSLQPLLRDFAAERPQRWASIFGPDAARLLQLISRQGESGRKEQHRFAIEQMNVSSILHGKRKWAIREPWVTYFRRLSEDREFQKIQVRYVRDLLARAEYYCRHFKLKSEQAFAFMFDAVSSHGKWWLNKKFKKFGGQEKRRILIEQRMKVLVHRHGEGKVPESEILLSIADVLGATSAPRWAAKVRERKRWFVTGKHPRARELRGLEPRPEVPYSVSAGARVVPSIRVKHERNTDLGATIARIAEQEYRRWHPATGNVRETDSSAIPILQEYYREALNRDISATDLQNIAWQKRHPWSAVFVSWVMRKAGAGAGFAYSAAHQGYIRAARRNRLEGVSSSPFWAYRATEVAPQIGDLICASRSNSGATYDSIAEPQVRATHCDIVTEVRPGFLRVVGGNVRENVDAKTIRIQPDGRLALDGNQGRFFAIVRCRGEAGDQGLRPRAPT